MKLKIKKQFWDEIVNGNKTKEFRKVNFFNAVNDDRWNMFLHNGRVQVVVIDNVTKDKLGDITFNGYKIIDKEKLFSYIVNNLPSYIMSEFDLDNIFNVEFIINNFKWFKEYYKDETEILILNIESFHNCYEN